MKLIIDRFEGEFAIVEINSEKIVDVPRCLFPDAKEGDVIDISIDTNETKKRKEKIQYLMNDLFE